MSQKPQVATALKCLLRIVAGNATLAGAREAHEMASTGSPSRDTMRGHWRLKPLLG